MISYFIIRLGVDSEPEIRQIDSFCNYSTSPFPIDVLCRQVPKGLSRGDFAVIWLGTNNNKGGKTPWVQGVRALAQVEDVLGDGGYNSAKIVRLTVRIVFPQSITKMDIVTKESARYPDIAAMPVLGVNNYSSQVVQRIEIDQPGQSLHALFGALNGILPGLYSAIISACPELTYLFNEDRPVVEVRESSVEPVDLQGQLDTTIPNTRVISSDDDGLDPDEDRETEIDVPFDPTKIDIIAKPMTISSLEDRLDNNELDLTPDFQRNANVWDAKRKARLIESILLKIPLPSFYFSEDLEGGYAVVDGLQRLCAVFHFKSPSLLNATTGSNLRPLRLKGLQYLKELEGKTFADMDRKFQRRISELEITANIIRASTPSAVKFNVFARLNQGGMPLNAQEIRNAIFPGDWRNELRALAESPEFIAATDNKVRRERQQDMELVLRYIALWQLGSPYRRPGGQTLDEFLNVTVETVLMHWTPTQWEQAAAAFYGAISAACLIRGKHAFRKSGGTQPRKPINRGLFEAELIVFGSLDPDQLASLEKKKDHAEQMIMDALSYNGEFQQSLLYGTGSPESSNARVFALSSIVKEAINA